MCQALCWTWGFETVKEVGLALGENRQKPRVTLCQDAFRDRSTCMLLLGGDYYLDVLGEVGEGGSAGCEPTHTWISLPTLPCSVITVPFRGIKLARGLVSVFSGL